MAAFNILEHLDRLTPDGGSNDPRGDHSFHCPACGAPNFKVNISTALWCGFNCDCAATESGKRQIRQALSPAINPEAKPRRQVAERHWDYFTAVTLKEGKAAITVNRWDDPSKPDGDGWKNGRKINQTQRIAKGVATYQDVAAKVLPYRYAEAKQALDDGAPFIFWPEGESCCDALRALGLPAITNIGGAGKFNPDRDGPAVTGINANRLVIVPDRDKPGLKHAEDIAAAYPGCQWLYAFPGTPQWNGSCPSKGGLDIADWIAHGATIEQIMAGVGPKQHGQKQPAPEPGLSPADGEKELTMAERINAGVEALLQATLADDHGEIDASLTELYRLGVSRERSQERMLMLWAERHGYNLSTGGGSPTTGGRTFGKAKEGAGLRQQLPGFLLDRDLHLLVATAFGGKTTACAELANVMSARDRGFLDHEAPRTDDTTDTRNTVLVIASDGEASAWDMWEAYLQDLNTEERGANIEIWAQDDDTGEQAWNVSLRNLDRLARRLEKGDLCLVVMDTANAILRGAGVHAGIGPIETYLRLLKQIVCRHCALLITHHTNRSGTPDLKGIGGHAAFQEVPSVIHMIEAKQQADGSLLRLWHVLKLRGSNYRKFAYELRDGRLVVTEGHLFENCDQQVLLALHNQLLIKAGTAPGELIRVTKRPPQSVYNTLDRLRGAKLVRRYGNGYRFTPSGQAAVDAMRV